MQQEYFGMGSIKRLKDILVKEKPEKIFLVTGKSSYQSSGAQEKLETLLSSYQYVHFFDFTTNAKIEDIEKGIKVYKKEQCDLTIAIGGGSVIDIAKAINLLANQSKEPKGYIFKEKEIEEEGKPLIAIPTTSGSGSEATRFVVIYMGKTKYSLAHNCILPNYAIIDPALTFNLPKRITAVTGMDALSQAIESYWNVNSTDESKEYAKKSIKLILPIETAVNCPTFESRNAMANAANLAGKAINISSTTTCHAISYPLTSYFGIPHGHAVALTLGEIFVYNSNINQKDCLDKRGTEYVKESINELIRMFDAKNAQEVNKKIRDTLIKIGLESRLSEFGILKEQLNKINNNINYERLKNNPRRITKNDISEIIHNIL